MEADKQPITPIAVILELSRLVCATLDFSEVFERILEATERLSGADVLSIMLLDEQQEALSIAAIRGLELEPLADLRFRFGEGIVGWAVEHNQAAHVLNPLEDPRFKVTNGLQYGTLYAVPLRGHQRVLGCLSISRINDQTPFSEHACQMIEVFASHAAIAIENASAARALQISAAREHIYGLRSRSDQADSGSVIEQILAELGTVLTARACRLEVQRNTEHGICYHWPSEAPAPATGPLLSETVPIAENASILLQVFTAQRSPYHHTSNRAFTRFVAEQIAILLREEDQRLIAQQRRALDDILIQIGAASHALVGEEHALETILARLAEFVAYDSAGVFVYHNTRYARLAGGRGYRTSDHDIVLDMGPGSLPWEINRSRRARYIPDVQVIPQWQSVRDAEIVRSWIGVPLLVDDTMIGLLTVDRWMPCAFGPNDVAIAERFGSHLALAIRNARLVQEAKDRANQLHVLHRLGVQIGAIQHEQELFDTVARLIQRTFGYYQVVIATIDDHEIALQSAFGALNDRHEFGDLQRYSIQRGFTGLAARSAETVLINNVLDDPRYAPVERLERTRAELVVPIKSEGEVLGIIDIESDLVGAFGEQDVQVAEALAGQIGVALRNIRRYRQLEHTQNHLIHSERLRVLGELSSGIAHDFNNLLTSILGHTQLLLHNTDNPKIRDELEIIERAAFDGAATVRRLQSVAQINHPLPAEPINLNEIVDESLAITRPRWRDSLQSRGAQLSIRHEPGQLPLLWGDQAALRDMTTNLILNAIDAMPLGGVLTIRTRRQTGSSEGDEAVLLEVRDTGSGMAADLLPKIFAPFFSTKGARGTGMGLAMVHSTVERHHGRIEVQSTPEQGSTFTVILPVRTPDRPGIAAVPTPNVDLPLGLQILVVEDDTAVQQVLAQMLRRFGHSVSLADNGAQALNLLDNNVYDLLCSDLGLPGMSGWDVIAYAREHHPQMATLLITGWGNQITLDEAQARGADGLIAKPFDAARLRRMISDVIQQKR